MKSVFAGFNFRRLDTIHCAMSSIQSTERTVSQQMESYLSAAGLLPRHQSAYRKGHSTETALVKVCSDLIGMMDSGEQAGGSTLKVCQRSVTFYFYFKVKFAHTSTFTGVKIVTNIFCFYSSTPAEHFIQHCSGGTLPNLSNLE